METLKIFNEEDVSEEELKDFRHRRAVRGVVFDADKNIALLHAVKEGYYGLPGGGVDKEESFEQGVIRECKEEIGCDINIISKLGKTLEYRKKHTMVNESHGFTANVIGEKGSPIFIGDENEAEKNSVIIWTPILKAIELMENTTKQENLYSQYCIERDLIFIKQAQKISN